MGGNGLFVQCGLRKVYRLFSDTSVHSLGQHGSNDLFVWEHPSAPIVQQHVQLGSDDGFVWEHHSAPIIQPLHLLGRKECECAQT